MEQQNDEIRDSFPSGKPPKSGSFRPEWVATLPRNQWQVSNGMGGRFGPESTLLKQNRKERTAR